MSHSKEDIIHELKMRICAIESAIETLEESDELDYNTASSAYRCLKGKRWGVCSDGWARVMLTDIMKETKNEDG